MIVKHRSVRGKPFLLLVVVVFAVFSAAICLGEAVDEPSVLPEDYVNTLDVAASLYITNGSATCTGWITPYGTHSCSLTLRLYKKNGNTWTKITGWSTNTTGGEQAYLCRSATVGLGTYKVLLTGSVDGEVVSITSNIVTY